MKRYPLGFDGRGASSARPACFRLRARQSQDGRPKGISVACALVPLSMKGLDSIAARVERELDAKDRVREAALRAGRSITRLAGTAVRGMHRGEDVRETLAQVSKEVRALRAMLRDHPEFWRAGAVEGALQEAAEAAIVHRIVHGRPLPTPRALGVTGPAYLLGLADAVGELRRFALDGLRKGRLEEAEGYLHAMEEVYHTLLRFDYPDAIVPLRHKQDVARSLLERTRGELAVAARSAELERKLDRLSHQA